jgi:hypothetical protein
VTEDQQQHVLEIVDDFLVRELHAECSCGWRGDLAESVGDAQEEWAAHTQDGRRP